MYNVSSNFKNYIKMPSRTLSSRLVISSNTYTDSEIVDMNLESNLVPGEEFALGCTVCNKFEATVMNTTPILVLNIVKPYIGLNINGVVEELPLGVFTIDDAKVTKSNTKIVAYDNMIKFEKAYFSDLTYPATIQTVATEICQKAGVSFSSSLPNNSIDKIEGKTLREAIGIIAGICGGFARINRIGNLEIVGLTATDVSITAENFFGSIEKADKNFTIKKITAIKEDNSIISSGSGLNSEEITLSNNYITKAQLDSILTTYSNYSYRALKLNWQGNPALDVGDKIAITDIDNTVYSIPVMRLKLTYQGGLKSEISSVAKGDSKSEYDYKGPVSKKMDRMLIEQANIKVALIEKANIDDLTATNARIDTANINIATINNLLAGNLSAANMQANFITANSGLIADAAIKDAMIDTVSVNKILAGDISTTKFKIVSDSGKMLISDNTIQIKDATRVRVQIGKDASNDYNMYVWDASGNLMFDATGLKASGIKNKIIRDDMVSDTANINGSKIEKESLVTQINGATNTLKASKVKLDTENQTLDLAFTSLKNTVTSQENTITNQGTSINTIQGQISSKVWQSDITTAVNAIQVGGRNLVPNSKIAQTSNVYGFGTRTLTIDLTAGVPYTFTVNGRVDAQAITDGKNLTCYVYEDTWTHGSWSFAINVTTDTTKSITFTPSWTGRFKVTFYLYPTGGSRLGIATVNWCKLELGNKATDWAPAPEDIDSQITTINNNYTSLNQTVSSISASVSSLQTNTSDLGTRMTSAESSITALNSSIVLKVTQTDIDNSINNTRTMVKLNGLELLNLEYKANVNTTNKLFTAGTYSIAPATEIGGNINEQNLIKTINSQFLYTPYIACNSNSTQYFKISVYNLDTNNGTLYVQCCYYDKDKVAVATNEAAANLIANVSNTVANVWNTFEGYIDPFQSTDVRQKAVFMRIRVLTRYTGQTGTTYLKDLSWKQLSPQTNANNETRISSAESSITALNNSISLKVETSVFNSYKTSNDSAVSSLTSRISAAEIRITDSAIVSTVRSSTAYTSDLGAKVSTANLSSEIQQRAGDVQVAFNNITSNIQNAGGTFSIINGRLVVKNGNSEVVIDGQYNMHKIITSGYFTYTIGLGQKESAQDIVHNLGYKPCFSCYLDSDGQGRAGTFPLIGIADYNTMQIGTIGRAGADNRVIRVTYSRLASAGLPEITVTIKYYIYKEVAL